MAAYYHKRFQRLGIYISHTSRNNLPFQQILAKPLTECYSTFLRGSSFNGIHSINLYLTSAPVEEGERVVKEVLGFADYYAPFDFNAFARLATDKERQHYLLDSVQQAVSQLAQHECWDMLRFEQAYQGCLTSDLPVSIRYWH